MKAHLSGNDRLKILKKMEEGERFVAVPKKNGRRLVIYGLEEYLAKRVRMREVIKRVQPWKRRQKSLLGPIGSRPLGLKSQDLSRAAIYADL